MRRSAAVTTVVAAGLLGTGLVGVANAANTTVTGSVKTAGGVGVPGVAVTVKVGTQTRNATTNGSGNFSLTARTGTATVTLNSPATPTAGLPQVWQFKNVSATIGTNQVLNFSLPATSSVAVKTLRAKTTTTIPNVAVDQCSKATSDANAHVVLAGSPAVAPTQDFTGATTDAAGMVTLNAFKDSTFGRLCGRFTETTGGATTTYAARGPIRDATVDTTMNIFAPQVVTQAGTVRDSLANGKSGVKVALRSAGGQVDSVSAPTTATGAFSTQISPGNVFARISSRSLSAAVAPPTNIPRSFKATIDGTADGTTPWAVNLPGTVTLTVKVQNADGSPVKNAIVRPLTTGAFDAANSAVLVAGQPSATITQQIYGDNLSGDNGEVYVRLFADSNLGGFKVIKNLAGTSSRETTVPAGNVVISNTSIIVTLPPAA
ncbi:MAG TPA: hypothetical protein VFX15_10350 [Actinomycetes bacterium]|nr:hypothetical protein [Actinomycetes bacterium]